MMEDKMETRVMLGLIRLTHTETRATAENVCDFGNATPLAGPAGALEKPLLTEGLMV